MTKRLIPLLLLPAVIWADDNTDSSETSGEFKESTATDYFMSNYAFEESTEDTPEDSPEIEENTTPLKDPDFEDRPGRVDRYSSEEQAMDTIELDEYKIEEFSSPLMRMSYMKSVEELEPESAPAHLKEEYFEYWDRALLNRYTIPLIGKSAEQRAKERYEREKNEQLVEDVENTTDFLETVNETDAESLSEDLNDIRYQLTKDR